MKDFYKKVIIVVLSIFVIAPVIRGFVHVGDTVYNEPSEPFNYNGYFSQPIIDRYNHLGSSTFHMYSNGLLSLSVDTRVGWFPFFNTELVVINAPLNYYDGIANVDINFYGVLQVKSTRKKLQISGYDFISNTYLMGHELTWTDDTQVFITLGGLL